MKNAKTLAVVLKRNEITKLHVEYIPKNNYYIPISASHPRVNEWYFDSHNQDLVMDIPGDRCGIDPENWFAYYAIIRGIE